MEHNTTGFKFTAASVYYKVHKHVYTAALCPPLVGSVLRPNESSEGAWREGRSCEATPTPWHQLTPSSYFVFCYFAIIIIITSLTFPFTLFLLLLALFLVFVPSLVLPHQHKTVDFRTMKTTMKTSHTHVALLGVRQQSLKRQIK